MKDQDIQEVHGVANIKRVAPLPQTTERVLITDGTNCVYLRQVSADHTCELTCEEAEKLSAMLKAAAVKAKKREGEA